MNYRQRFGPIRKPPYWGNIKQEAIDMNPSLIDIARVCHEANRGYCAALGDTSQLPWVDAPDWQKESAIKGVEFIHANPDAPASSSHESWLAEKESQGWEYGPVKDPEHKLHPCCVPYEQLPVEQKAKDYIFGAVARAMLAR